MSTGSKGRMRKTWRLQGRSGELAVVRRSDVKKDEKTLAQPLSLAFNLDRWLADPISRNALLDMHRSLGGSLAISAQRMGIKGLNQHIKPQLERAFQRGELVVLPLELPLLVRTLTTPSKTPQEKGEILSGRKENKPADSRQSWISVSLVRMPDQKARPQWWPPVKDKAYVSERFSAEVTNGHKDGSLNADGVVQFDNIPAGRCQILFKDFYKEIDQFFDKVHDGSTTGN